MSRGTTVMSKTFSMTGKSHLIDFLATEEMAPKSQLIAYAMRNDNKEIIVDATDFKVNGMFRNQVKLILNKDKAKPGEDIKIHVKSSPNSFLGLLAVDKSVLLLNSKDNDITAKMVRN